MEKISETELIISTDGGEEQSSEKEKDKEKDEEKVRSKNKKEKYIKILNNSFFLFSIPIIGSLFSLCFQYGYYNKLKIPFYYISSASYHLLLENSQFIYILLLVLLIGIGVIKVIHSLWGLISLLLNKFIFGIFVILMFVGLCFLSYDLNSHGDESLIFYTVIAVVFLVALACFNKIYIWLLKLCIYLTGLRIANIEKKNEKNVST